VTWNMVYYKVHQLDMVQHINWHTAKILGYKYARPSKKGLWGISRGEVEFSRCLNCSNWIPESTIENLMSERSRLGNRLILGIMLAIIGIGPLLAITIAIFLNPAIVLTAIYTPIACLMVGAIGLTLIINAIVKDKANTQKLKGVTNGNKN
jgi:hypothetical protein